MISLKEKREFLKSDFPALSDIVTDQAKGLPMPPIEKELQEGDILISLPKVSPDKIKKDQVFQCLQERRSRRNLDKGMISLDELSYLLYMTQGVQRVFKRSEEYKVTIRTAPSAGARHPFETYLLVNKIEELERGVYRYMPLNHQLVHQKKMQYSDEKLSYAVNNQEFVTGANVVFLWSAVPYRTEWRYATESAKLILLDAGHVCQNLYIAAESLGLGTCGIAAYKQKETDELIGLDGEEEMVVYLAPVGVC